MLSVHVDSCHRPRSTTSGDKITITIPNKYEKETKELSSRGPRGALPRLHNPLRAL